MKEDSIVEDSKEKEQLMSYINDAIMEIAAEKEGRQANSISRSNPEKVAKILYLSALGFSQTSIVRSATTIET